MKKEISIPRIMIAAPKSGSGKTIFTCGLLNLLNKEKREEEKVVAFKCGPDYIDPMFHRNVIGITSKNLDSFFSSDEEILDILRSSKAHEAVLEGVMGIYDGIGRGSGYEIASITRTPIILVMDGRGIWNTIISLVKGIVLDDVNGLIKGIVINRVSQKYYQTIAPLMNEMLKEIGSEARALGFIPESKDLNLESRHLGLKMPNEIEDLRKQVDGFSDLIREHCSLEDIKRIMAEAKSIEEKPSGKEEMETPHQWPKEQEPILAVARDEGFCFYYDENLRALEEAGISIVEFSPIHDKKLPYGISGILLGGGYPELYLKELEANKSMREDIAKAIESGMPSLAECGGFMYLLGSIVEKDSEVEMAGVIPGKAYNTGKLSRFGYVNITSNTQGLLEQGETIKGHEFHYYDSNNNGKDCIAKKPEADISWECIHNRRNLFWGYPHLYYSSNPSFIARFKEAMKEYIKING